MPNCPDHFDDVAQNEWEFIVPHFERMRLLFEIDKAALSLDCLAYSHCV